MDKTMSSPKVYIIVLNYKTWEDTIECIESLLVINYDNYEIIIIDNDSKNDSLKNLLTWAVDENNKPSNAEKHSSKKQKEEFNRFNFTQLEYTKDNKFIIKFQNKSGGKTIELIDSGINLGYAYGNNCGIKRVQEKGDADFVWILNNDTIVDADSLKNMVNTAISTRSNGLKIGLIGSVLLYYDNRKTIQGVAGHYNKIFGTSEHIDVNKKFDNQFNDFVLLKENQYPIGASLLASIDFIKDVGCMSEEYFLFYEELDWCIRGLNKGWSSGYCGKSLVYHKEGATIGTKRKNRSELAEFYLFRNRILFTKKYFICYSPIIIARLFFMLIKRALLNRPGKKTILDAILQKKNYIQKK